MRENYISGNMRATKQKSPARSRAFWQILSGSAYFASLAI
jgi:hypothetical protein